MIAPAAARAMAGLILAREPGLPVDVNLFSAARFRRGELIREPAVV
jgi:glycine/D-amino acid oxidase-like deaminating enzyme